jgi:hypothetical protein
MEPSSQIAAEAPRPWARRVVVLPVLVVVALVGAAFPSFSIGANVLVLAAGGTLFWLGVTRRVPSRPAPRQLPRQAAWWLLPLFSFAVAESINFALGSTYVHPTFSRLADPMLAEYLARAAAYLAWLGAFWGLVRR